MNKKIKTLFLTLVAIIGFSFTQDVSAKVCVYMQQNTVNASGTTIVTSRKEVKVSYDDSHICYYIDGDKGECLSTSGFQRYDSADLYIENKTSIESWKADPDGCLDNLNVATGTFTRSGFTVDTYIFTTETSDQAVVGRDLILKPSAATFVEAKDTVTVTFLKPDGTTQTEEVAFGGKATNMDVVAGEGKDFSCWKKADSTSCFNFNNTINHDIVLVAEIVDQKYVAGFEKFGMNVTCNGEEIPYGLPYMISRLIDVLKILTPIILIVLGMVDYGKAVMSGKEDVMKKCSSAFVRRVVAAVLIFFTVALVQFGFSLLGDSGNAIFECFDCFVGGNCDVK